MKVTRKENFIKNKEVKDKDTGTIFDDYVPHEPKEEYDTDAWTQVCDACAVKHHLIDSYLDINSGHGICGVKGCDKESDHYYDFIIERGEEGKKFSLRRYLDEENRKRHS